jgi:hypothetical protein
MPVKVPHTRTKHKAVGFGFGQRPRPLFRIAVTFMPEGIQVRREQGNFTCSRFGREASHVACLLCEGRKEVKEGGERRKVGNQVKEGSAEREREREARGR